MSAFYNRFNWITLAKDLSTSEKTLSFALLKHLNAQGTCWPSKRLLAEETGLSTRHIRRLIVSLVQKGILECTPRTGQKNYRNTSNLYTFHFPPRPEPEPRQRKAASTLSPLPPNLRLNEHESTVSPDRKGNPRGQDDTSRQDIMTPHRGHGGLFTGDMAACSRGTGWPVHGGQDGPEWGT